MYTLKVITTVFIWFMILSILLFARGFKWSNDKDKASIIGFVFMEIVYVLSLVCMWA